MRQLVCIMFISNNHPLFQLWRKGNLVKHRKVSKHYETDCGTSFRPFKTSKDAFKEYYFSLL